MPGGTGYGVPVFGYNGGKMNTTKLDMIQEDAHTSSAAQRNIHPVVNVFLC